MIKGGHTWIVCTICNKAIKDTLGGICRCGNIKVSRDSMGIVTTRADDGDKIVYDTD